jgi:hypothetical protein
MRKQQCWVQGRLAVWSWDILFFARWNLSRWLLPSAGNACAGAVLSVVHGVHAILGTARMSSRFLASTYVKPALPLTSSVGKDH